MIEEAADREPAETRRIASANAPRSPKAHVAAHPRPLAHLAHSKRQPKESEGHRVARPLIIIACEWPHIKFAPRERNRLVATLAAQAKSWAQQSLEASPAKNRASPVA